MGRIIYHVDVNSAFLSWEATYRLYHLGAKLDLRTVPSAVGGDQEKRHGIILAKSIPCTSMISSMVITLVTEAGAKSSWAFFS